MSSYHFVWFSDHSDAEAVRIKVLETLGEVAPDAECTLEWNDSTRRNACGEVTLAGSPLFSIDLSIRPDEYFETDRELVAGRVPENSRAKRKITELLDATNTLVALTPLSEDPDDVAVKLLSTLAEANQPAIMAMDSGTVIYDASGKLIYPRSLLPHRWTRLT